jgi:hypothetical protein
MLYKYLHTTESKICDQTFHWLKRCQLKTATGLRKCRGLLYSCSATICNEKGRLCTYVIKKCTKDKLKDKHVTRKIKRNNQCQRTRKQIKMRNRPNPTRGKFECSRRASNFCCTCDTRGVTQGVGQS